MTDSGIRNGDANFHQTTNSTKVWRGETTRAPINNEPFSTFVYSLESFCTQLSNNYKTTKNGSLGIGVWGRSLRKTPFYFASPFPIPHNTIPKSRGITETYGNDLLVKDIDSCNNTCNTCKHTCLYVLISYDGGTTKMRPGYEADTAGEKRALPSAPGGRRSLATGFLK